MVNLAIRNYDYIIILEKDLDIILDLRKIN